MPSVGTINAVAAGVLVLMGLHAVVAALRTDLPWRRWRVAAMLVCRLGLLAALAAWCLDVRLRLPRGAGRVELVVLADRSASIGPEGQQAIRQWIATVEATAAAHGGWIAIRTVQAADGRGTPLAEALREARLAFPGQGEKRLLVLSDGCATTGDPLLEVPQFLEDGVKTYAVSTPQLAGESLVAEFQVPAAAWRSVPVPVEVMLQSDHAGTCRLTVQLDGREQAQPPVPLRRGRTPVTLPIVFDKEGLHQVEVRAEFPQDHSDWNNRAAALIDVPLAPRIIVVSETPAAGHPLRVALEANGLPARVVAPQDLPAQFSADCIVLDNVRATAVGDARLAALDEFARAGGALLFTGGRRAFGGGGYRGTPLEPAFPVHLDPQKEYPPFALAVVLDNSWSMNEALAASVGKIDVAKEIAIAAMEGLHHGDWLTLVSFDAEYHNIIPPTKVQDLEPAKYEVARIGAFGMTNILGGLAEAARILRPLDAPFKHILLISDGRETETGTDYSLLLASLEKMRVTLSTIGVGSNVNARLLNTLAYAGKGRYHHTQSVKEIPAIALQEAKGPENQLLVEMSLPAKKLAEDPALANLDVAAWPPLGGYNRARARLPAWTPLVISPKNEPLLARMRYGRGHTAAFLSSATPPWGRPWIEEQPAEYVRFWRQLLLSLLAEPHRPLRPRVEYQDGRPTFDFSAEASGTSGGSVARPDSSKGVAEVSPIPPTPFEDSGRATQDSAASAQRRVSKRATSETEVHVSQLVGTKVDTAPSQGDIVRTLPDADALLVLAKGKHIGACSWSRTYGREFGDPAQGESMLKNLCEQTGGLFHPQPDDLFAGSEYRPRPALPRTAWLLAAVVLLVVEILVRRLPALGALLRRSGVAAAIVLLVLLGLKEPTAAAEGGLREARPGSGEPGSAPAAGAMAVRQQGARLIVTGANFRYIWDTRRGGELAAVEQPGPADGWWVRGLPGYANSPWQRVNSTFAWKSLDTIPALSFSTKRMAYYSGEGTIAYANADRNAKLNILRQSDDELVFETHANPRILENLRLPVAWKVRQRVRVFDSGVVLIGLEVTLPADESYELDWASASVNLDDSLYKEPSPERQTHFSAGSTVPGDPQEYLASYKAVYDDRKHLPLDIDVRPEESTLTQKPLLFGWAAYDLTHRKDAAPGGFAECCLAEAKSLVGTKDDFGSHVMIRPASGMSPVPTEVGSMRPRPCFEVGWNLFDGATRGLTEPLKYENTLMFAVGARKRSSRRDAPADDRNGLLGARVYYARGRLPAADEIRAMAAEGCDTLILGSGWRSQSAETTAAVAAAHAAGMRVGATVDLKDVRTLVKDAAWFSKPFEKNRDGLLVTGVSFLDAALPAGTVEALGEQLNIAHDGPHRTNAAALAVCMKTLRRIVGPQGFLIGDPGAFAPNLLSLAECDLHASADVNRYRWGTPQERCLRRYRAAAGWAPITDALAPPEIALAAVHADTPLILWPPKDKRHLAWWELCQRLPAGGARVQSDLLPVERQFTVSATAVHGTLFDSGNGRALLLLAAEKDEPVQVRLTVPVKTARTLDGKDVPVQNGMLDAGKFAAWQVKGFELTLATDERQGRSQTMECGDSSPLWISLRHPR